MQCKLDHHRQLWEIYRHLFRDEQGYLYISHKRKNDLPLNRLASSSVLTEIVLLQYTRLSGPTRNMVQSIPSVRSPTFPPVIVSIGQKGRSTEIYVIETKALSWQMISA